MHSDLAELCDADGTHDVVTLSGVFHELPKDVVPLVRTPIPPCATLMLE